MRLFPGDLVVPAKHLRAELAVCELLGADLEEAGELRLPVPERALRWFVEVALPLLLLRPERDLRVTRPLERGSELAANVQEPWRPLARAVASLGPDELAEVTWCLSYVGNATVEELCAASFAHRARAANAAALRCLLRPWRSATGPARPPVEVGWMFTV